jgi:hypothetical protein
MSAILRSGWVRCLQVDEHRSWPGVICQEHRDRTKYITDEMEGECAGFVICAGAPTSPLPQGGLSDRMSRPGAM